MTKVVRLDVWTAPCFDQTLAQDACVTLDVLERSADDAEHLALLSQAEIYHISAARDEVPAALQVTAELIRNCPKLKCVSTSGAGYDTVDVEACSAAGILVVNQAGGNAQSVAEHALAMMLGLARRFPESGDTLKHRSGIDGGSPMRPLGVMSVDRSDIAPDLPTFKEQGYDIIMSSLRGIGAPKGLPADVREKLVEAVRKASEDPAFREQARKMFVPLRYLGPDAYTAELESNEIMFKQVWRDSPWSD